MTVLVVARDFDPTVDAVVQALTDQHVPVFRTDLADFPVTCIWTRSYGPDGGRGTCGTIITRWLWRTSGRSGIAIRAGMCSMSR